jgi:hypothetical protein
MTRSSIDELPDAVRDAVHAAIRDGRATIDEIVSLIERHGATASRSAVGRYTKKFQDRMAEYRQAQEMSRVWVDALGSEPEGDVSRLLNQMLVGVATNTVASMSGEEVDPKDLAVLAKASRDIASAEKLNAERVLKLRQEVARQAADTAARVAKKGGLSAVAVQELRREILGIAG